MKILLLIITIISVSCFQRIDFTKTGYIITKKELHLSRETNYKNEPIYFISRFYCLNTKETDRIHTIGAISRGTVIPFNSIEKKSDLYIGNSNTYRGEFSYKKNVYSYEATFYEFDNDKDYINVILK
jgi:hypothetical protein